MDETVFNALADAELARVEEALEECDAELDIECKPGGVLELEFENGSKVIINRHTAAREIWVAAKSGGFHFRPQASAWLSGRDGTELYALLSQVVSEQSGRQVVLAPSPD